MDTNLSKLWETVDDRGSWYARGPRGHKEMNMTYRLNDNNNLSRQEITSIVKNVKNREPCTMLVGI